MATINVLTFVLLMHFVHTSHLPHLATISRKVVMTDVAAVVTGLPASFISCVQCFEIIQYGRNLQSEHDHLVDRLHHIGVKLSRWGKSRGLLDDNLTPIDSLPDREGCQEIFTRILGRFEEAREKGKRYELNRRRQGGEMGSSDALELDGEENIAPSVKSFRTNMRSFMSNYTRRSRNAGIRVRWAIYERQVLTNLVNNLRSDVEDLVELFPQHVVTPEKDLILREVQNFPDDAISIAQVINEAEKLISEKEVEKLLETAVTEEIERREQQGRPIHRFENFDITKVTDTQIGNRIARGSEAEKMGSVFKMFKISGAKGLRVGHEYQAVDHKNRDCGEGRKDSILES
jgi:hypothetical protein